MARRYQHEVRLNGYYLCQKRGSPNWHAGWNDPERRASGPRRVSLGTADRAEAERRLAEWVVRNGKLPRAEAAMTFAQVAALYVDRHAAKLPSEDVQRRALGYWLDHFGGALVAEITKARQLDFLDDLRARGLKPGYVKRTFGAGVAAIRWAHYQEIIPAVPAFLHKLEGSAPRERTFTAEEIAAFWAAIEDEHLAMFFVVALNTGARPRAVLDLTMDQVDLPRRVLDLNPAGRAQTHKQRPMVKISATLAGWLARAAGPFVVSYRGAGVGSISRAWQRTRERAGLDPDIVPYTIRHTVATILDEAGVPENEIASFMGWRSSTRMTDWYIKRRIYRPDYQANVVAALDRWMTDLGLTAEEAPVGAGASSIPNVVYVRAASVTTPKLSGRKTR